MKALRFLGIALTAVTMCAGLAACSDGGDGGQKSQNYYGGYTETEDHPSTVSYSSSPATSSSSDYSSQPRPQTKNTNSIGNTMSRLKTTDTHEAYGGTHEAYEGTYKYDLLLDMLASPNASLDDFVLQGYNGSTAGLHTKEEYRSYPEIREYFSDSNGNFDEKWFDKVYRYAQYVQNYISTTSFEEAAINQATFAANDILAPADRRMPDDPRVQTVKTSNPEGVTIGLSGPGVVSGSSSSE